MKIFQIKKIAFIFIIAISTVSCVSTKKYNEALSRRELSDKENGNLKDENLALQNSNKEYSNLVNTYGKQIENLVADTTALVSKYRLQNDNYLTLDKNYKQLLKIHNDLIAGNKVETKKIMAELQNAQTDLIKREDNIAALEKKYASKKTELDSLTKKLEEKQNDLDKNTAAYNALNKEVAKKDSMMNALKTSVTNALVGFENQGLTVSTKNGRVYVSLENQLMFPSGSFDLNPKGESALLKLADVLKDNNDINILVEGNTDSLAYSGTGKLLDNWDLSAKRATSIVRILIKDSKINPAKITAAGRGEFNPIESNATAEGRAKNRRTEIILMPNLSELYEIVK